MDALVIGSGPAGVMAALRAAELGARTTLVARDRFGGMAAGDGPVPVRTLAHAARLIREARQLKQYGIEIGEPVLDYRRLLARVQEVVGAVQDHSLLRKQVDQLGITLHEKAGPARFVDPHTVEGDAHLRLTADRIILCPGGRSRRLDVPGSDLTLTHSDAWSLTEVPPSMLVIGAGMTGLQVASIFQAFGTQVQLLQSGPRILAGEDPDVSAALAAELRAGGMVVREGFGTIERFEAIPGGIRMTFAKDGVRGSVEAALAVRTIGWVANTEGLNLESAGVELDAKGFVKVDRFLCTAAEHIFAAGDATGRFMLVPPAVLDGHVAATNAVQGPTLPREDRAGPTAGFTDPEYGHIGATEAAARQQGDVVVSRVGFGETVRTVIDGRTSGFCKLIADRKSGTILGCHVVGERAADIVQVAAIAMEGRLRVQDLARVPLAFPTYSGILARAAYRAAREIDPSLVAP
ncbi:MAG: dihydrolipoyl dehydrogenase family protein [Candidatus Eiseniibacteriota bacterium]